jgi:uncharacterized membrane protein
MFGLKKKWKDSKGYQEIYQHEAESNQEEKSQKEDEEFLQAVNAGMGCLRYFIALILLIFLIMVALAVVQ